MEKHYPKMYADKIYPAIYGKEYEEPVQTNMFDKDTLDSTPDIIDVANKERQQSTRFKKGNQSGIQFAPKDADNQLDFDDIDNTLWA